MDIDERLAKWDRVEMGYDLRGFPERDKRFLQKLIEAGRYMDEAFWRQSWKGAVELRDRLRASDSKEDRKLLRLLAIMAGPHDRLADFEPFMDASEKPLGAGFYPEDLTKEEFERYIADHPEEKEVLLSPYTVIRREGGRLLALPYHEEYGEFVEPASRALREAAELTDNPSLKNYLRSRADALLTDDYYQSDIDWINLQENDYDIIIGPYEFYEDRLMGVKAAYEASVEIVEREESRKLEIYIQHLEALERNLPYPDRYKRTIEGLRSPFAVVRDIYRGGHLRAGVQATAANLPNDPRVHTQYGTKKTFWMNIREGKWGTILLPLAELVIVPQQVGLVNYYAAFTLTMLHEMAHALGPRWVSQPDGSSSPLNEALKERASPLEEGKADVCGLHSLGYLMREGVIPEEGEREYYTTELLNWFHAMLFGMAEAHALGSLCQLNFYLEKGAVFCEGGRFGIEFDKIASSVAELAEKMLLLEATGDYQGTGEFFGKYGQMSETVERALAQTSHIPVDIEPDYRLLWE